MAAGFLYAFNPWHLQQAMHHAHASDIEFIPWFVLAYLATIEEHSSAWLAGTVVACTLAALSSWYFFVYLGLFALFYAFFCWWHEKAPPKGWALATPLLCFAAVSALLSPLVIPMLLASSAGIYDGGWNEFVTDVTAYFVPPITHITGAWTTPYYHIVSGFPWEATAYVGLINIGLLIWLYLRKRGTRDPLLFFVLSGLAVFCVLSSGPFLHVLGRTTSIAMPDVLFVNAPLLGSMRTSSRALSLAYLFWPSVLVML